MDGPAAVSVPLLSSALLLWVRLMLDIRCPTPLSLVGLQSTRISISMSQHSGSGCLRPFALAVYSVHVYTLVTGS